MKLFISLFFLFPSFTLFASKVDTIEVFSTCMNKQIKCVVITPDGYKKNKTGYPVVYLLHGYSGNYAQWINASPQLKRKADELQLIFVCPDGGYGSWYINSPIDTAYKYETFTANELVTYIDKHYKTIADKKHRAITGLSMGGHGALYLAIRNKEIFGLAGSVCGGVDIRPFPNNWDLLKRLGDTVCCKQNWEHYTVMNVVNDLKNGELKLIIDCGLGDFFLDVNRALHSRLLQMKIDHDYIERPGMHNTEYWGSAIDYQLLFFKKGIELSH
ncbi:MAG: esterase family protein [Chitinophagaceae bacterium]|nr:esterase family protein [Chitinophagaceae bacterium]